MVIEIIEELTPIFSLFAVAILWFYSKEMKRIAHDSSESERHMSRRVTELYEETRMLRQRLMEMEDRNRTEVRQETSLNPAGALRTLFEQRERELPLAQQAQRQQQAADMRAAIQAAQRQQETRARMESMANQYADPGYEIFYNTLAREARDRMTGLMEDMFKSEEEDSEETKGSFEF